MALVDVPAHAKSDSAGLYRLIAETIPHMVWTARHDGALDYFNSRCLQYTGLGAADLAGWGWKEVVHPADLERCIASWTRALQTGEAYEIEYRLRRHDGTYRWHHGTAVPVNDESGRPTRWFGTCTDIESEVRSARILEDMVDQRSRALRETERRFELFMEHVPAFAWIRDAQLRFTYVNRQYREAAGMTSEAMLGLRVDDLYSREEAELFTRTDRQVQASGAPVHFVEESHRSRWLKVKFPFPDAGGGVGVAGIAMDISERIRLEEALRESDGRFRVFMDNSPAIAWIKDAELRHVYVSTVFEKSLGKPRDVLYGRDDFEIWPRDVAEKLRRNDREVLEQGAPRQVVEDVPGLDGKVHHWLVVKFPLPDATGRPGVAGMAIDITARIEAEDLARRYAEDVRTLMDRLVITQESERRRLADNLHDLIGQNLTALGIDLASVRQRFQSGGDPAVGARLDAMKAVVEQTIYAIRGVMTDLRPPALEEYGLAPALRWYVTEFSERTGMKSAVHAGRAEQRLPISTELALFRIAQEALTNAAKHSGGTSVQVRIAEEGGQVRLTVEDDGRGFEDPVGARSARRGGWGLPAMRERAEAHGGRLRIEFPGRGTRLVVEVPAERAS